MVLKYDYKDHPCQKFNDFKPIIKFTSLDTASSMYKILESTPDIGETSCVFLLVFLRYDFLFVIICVFSLLYLFLDDESLITHKPKRRSTEIQKIEASHGSVKLPTISLILKHSECTRN